MAVGDDAVAVERRSGDHQRESQRVVARLPGPHRDLDAEYAILGATLELLGERGYSRLTMDEVAQRAHVGKATIYRRWPSKLPLVIDAVRRPADTQIPVPNTGSLDGDVLALIKTFLTALAEPLGIGLARLLADAAPNPGLRHIVYKELIRARQDSLRVVVERAIERGEVDRDADVDMLLELAAAAVLHRLVVSDEPFDEDFAARVARLLLLGVRPRQPSAEQPEPLLVPDGFER